MMRLIYITGGCAVMRNNWFLNRYPKEFIPNLKPRNTLFLLFT